LQKILKEGAGVLLAAGSEFEVVTTDKLLEFARLDA
jgi:hypothetical protein